MYYNNTSMSPTQDQDVLNYYHSDPIQIGLENQAYLQHSNNLTSSEMFSTNHHDFVSYSPESSSSAETNLVSPPQQYYDYSDFLMSRNNALKRSNSVPPHFHKSMQVKPLPIQIQKLTKEPISKASQKPVDPETYRRQLDEKLAKINFDDITVAELKETLRERGLSATGRKAELMNRLKEEYDLVINHNNSHVMLNRRIANLSLDQQKKSPKLSYSPYYTPPLRHSSISIAQMSHQLKGGGNRMASSVPNQSSFLNDQFMNFKPSCLRESIDETYIKEDEESHAQKDTTTVQPNIQYAPLKLEENVDVWDDQMLQNFLNQI